MNRFEWADATSVEEAIQLTVKGAAVKAGAVDLLDMMKERLASPSRLVNIRSIPNLDQINEDDKGVSIGPLATLTQISNDPILTKKYAAVALAAGKAATPQIRNMATAGGNLLQRPRCWYFRNELFPCRKKGGEICYAQQGENQYHAIYNNGLCAIVHPSALASSLVAMDATIDIQAPKEKRSVKLEEFFILPNVDLHRENTLAEGEIITNIRVPALASGARSFYIKQGEKESFDWPIAEVAVVLEADGNKCKRASIIMGAAAPVPHRAKEAEAALADKELTRENALAAADAALSSATPMTLNKYKIPLFRNLIARTILAAAGTQPAPSGEGTHS